MSPSHAEVDEPGKTTAEEEFQAATDRYRKAQEEMANGDASAMAENWSHEDDVKTMHPSGGRKDGWEAIKRLWEGFADACTDGTVNRTHQVIHVTGDLGYELCDESVSVTFAGEQISLEHRTTRVYRKENGDWKVVHHNADLVSEVVDKSASMSV